MASKITKRKDGLFQASYYVNTSIFGKKRQFVYGKTKEEVKQKRDFAISNNVLGHPLIKSKLTLDEYLMDWVQHAKRLSETTRSGYRYTIKKHIIPYIGNKKLSCLDTQILQQLINQLMEHGCSVRITQIVRSILSRALREAEPMHLVAPNIVKNVQLELYRPKKQEIWTKEDGERFIQVIKGHKYEFFFSLYITYGLRRGEAIPLTWEDIDFKQGIIHINKQYTIADNKFILTSPKTESSIRDLPILPHIKKILEELPAIARHGLIVSNDGKLINPRSIRHEFERLVKDNHLPPVTLHSLRHFAATGFKNNKFSIKDAQEILGHSTPLTTLQFYQHSSNEDKRNALSRYAKSMNFN